jgi:hypothetical protein
VASPLRRRESRNAELAPRHCRRTLGAFPSVPLLSGCGKEPQGAGRGTTITRLLVFVHTFSSAHATSPARCQGRNMRAEKAGWDRYVSQPLFLSVSTLRKYGASASAQGTHAQPRTTHSRMHTMLWCVFVENHVADTKFCASTCHTELRANKKGTPRTWAANRLSAKGWSRKMIWNATNAENISSCHANCMQEVQRCMNKGTHIRYHTCMHASICLTLDSRETCLFCHAS